MGKTNQRFKGIYRMPDSKFWWFRYTESGKRHAVSLRTSDEAEAITRARAILAEGLIASEAYTPSEPAPRRREIHDLINQYLKDAQNRHKKPLRAVTADVHQYILQKFVTDCSISRVGDINLSRINGWLDQLKKEGKSAHTFWSYAQRVRSFIKYLTPKYLSSTILSGFTMPEQPTNGRRNFVYKDEVTEVLDAVNGDIDLKFALFCGFDAGLRRNEISEAKVGWFDPKERLLYVSEHENFVPKDRDNRPIPLTDRFAEFLKGYLAGRNKNEYVLAPQKTTKGANRYRYDINKRVRSHFRRCETRSTMHDMRRSFGSNRVSAGLSPYKVAVWLGDRIDVVQRSYGHLVPQDSEINLGV
jgi:integrase